MVVWLVEWWLVGWVYNLPLFPIDHTTSLSHHTSDDSMLQSRTQTLQPINLLAGNYNSLNEQLEEALHCHSG